jgi:hypothetical protein
MITLSGHGTDDLNKLLDYISEVRTELTSKLMQKDLEIEKLREALRHTRKFLNSGHTIAALAELERAIGPEPHGERRS